MKTIEQINESKRCPFEKLIKVDKHLSSSTEREREKERTDSNKKNHKRKRKQSQSITQPKNKCERILWKTTYQQLRQHRRNW